MHQPFVVSGRRSVICKKRAAKAVKGAAERKKNATAKGSAEKATKEMK
jgi:hypothetical protein